MANLLGNVSCFCIQLTGCDELLYCIDGDRLVYSSSGAGIFAALVANLAAHRRERVILLYELKGLVISALARHFDIALNCDMCGARGLARHRAGIVALDLIILTVVVVPVLFTPVERFIRQRDGRVLDWSFMGTQLLSELGSARGTDFDALAAGNAVFRRDPRSVCRCRAVGVIKKLRVCRLYTFPSPRD